MSSTGPCNESHSLKASRWPSSAEAGVIPRETSEGAVRLANVKGGGGGKQQQRCLPNRRREGRRWKAWTDGDSLNPETGTEHLPERQVVN